MTRSSRPGSASTSGRSARDVDVDRWRLARCVVQRAADHVVEADRDGVATVSTPACSRDRSSRLVTSAVSRSSASSALASSSCRSCSLHVDVRAAQARHRGLGRRDRGAQVVADGVEQRGPHPVGLGERARPRRRPRRGGAAGRRRRPARRTRPARAGPRRPARGRAGRGSGRRRPAPRCRRLRAAGTGRRRRWPRTTRCRAARRRSVCGAAPTLAGASVSRRSRVTLCTAKVSWTRCSSAGRACSPRSTLPASVDSVSASAFARAASEVRRAARSTTRETSERDDDEDDQREDVVGLGDGEACGSAGRSSS